MDGMNRENIKNNDPLQLQQMIIFLRAELVKYKSEVEKYQDGDHYSLVELLEQENSQLTNEKNELSEKLSKLNKELEVRIHPHEIQSASSELLQETKTDLSPINKQLTEVIKKLKDGFNATQYKYGKHDKQVTSLHKKLADYKTTIEQLEHKLVHHIQEANKQVSSQIDKLEHTQFEKVNQHLINEIDVKNNTIRILQHDLSSLIEQNGKSKDASTWGDQSPNQKNESQASEPTIDPKTLIQLDQQIQEVLAQTLDYEKQLDDKFLILNSLENKLDQLAQEMDTIKALNIGGRILEKF